MLKKKKQSKLKSSTTGSVGAYSPYSTTPFGRTPPVHKPLETVKWSIFFFFLFFFYKYTLKNNFLFRRCQVALVDVKKMVARKIERNIKNTLLFLSNHLFIHFFLSWTNQPLTKRAKINLLMPNKLAGPATRSLNDFKSCLFVYNFTFLQTL